MPGGGRAPQAASIHPCLAACPSCSQMDPVTFRARSWLDASPDLQQPQVGGHGPPQLPGARPQQAPSALRLDSSSPPRPACRLQFDSRTVPVVFHPIWQYNYAHVATASLSWIYNNINQSSSADFAQRARQATASGRSPCQPCSAPEAPGLPCLEPTAALPPCVPAGWWCARHTAGPCPLSCGRCFSRCCAGQSPHSQSEARSVAAGWAALQSPACWPGLNGLAPLPPTLAG